MGDEWAKRPTGDQPYQFRIVTDQAPAAERILQQQLPQFKKHEEGGTVKYVRDYDYVVLSNDRWMKIFTDAGLALKDIACTSVHVGFEASDLQTLQVNIARHPEKHKRYKVEPEITVTLTDAQYQQMKNHYEQSAAAHAAAGARRK